jgi:hypothetical protein
MFFVPVVTAVTRFTVSALSAAAAAAATAADLKGFLSTIKAHYSCHFSDMTHFSADLLIKLRIKNLVKTFLTFPTAGAELLLMGWTKQVSSDNNYCITISLLKLSIKCKYNPIVCSNCHPSPPLAIFSASIESGRWRRS